MSELIDREALLDECLNHYEVGNIEQNCTMDWICKTVRNFPAASPWHRVEEELPKSGEFGEIVLACNDVGTVKAAYLLSNGKWYAANNTDWDAWTWMPNVTNWMPMPEPPKEDA